MNIAVIGGGLGGLAAAIALRQSGHEVTVYEQTERFRPAGAGISLWPNGVKALARLGLGGRLAEFGGRMDRMGYCDSGGVLLTEFSLSPLYEAVGERAWPVARSELQDLLLAAVGTDRVKLGCRCTGVDGGRIDFEGGGRAQADLVVGADGTHSKLRSWVAGCGFDRQYVGYVNFNGIAPADDSIAPPDLWRTWVGDGQRASVMPIGGGRVYAFFDVPSPAGGQMSGPAHCELETAFAGWAAPVQHLIASLPAGGLNRVAIHDLPIVDRWHRDRVVLLGDAVHSMAPDLGQGGCQALEDALVLSECLEAVPGPMADRLAAYQARRLPRTSEIVRRARKRAHLIHGHDPEATRAWYQSLRQESGEEVIDGLVQSVVSGPLG